MTKNGVVVTEIVFEFFKNFGAAFDVHQNIVGFHEFLDRVCQLTAAPIFETVNLTAVAFHSSLVTLNHRRDLFALIRMDDEANLIVTH